MVFEGGWVGLVRRVVGWAWSEWGDGWDSVKHGHVTYRYEGFDVIYVME